MTKKQIAAKLREAVKLMNDNGAHWVKGEYSEVVNEFDVSDNKVEPEFGYCSLGAIRKVAGDPLHDSSPTSGEVALALAEVLPAAAMEGAYTSSSDPDIVARSVAYDRIVFWNDDDDRVWPEVVEKFEEAAARLEAQLET